MPSNCPFVVPWQLSNLNLSLSYQSSSSWDKLQQPPPPSSYDYSFYPIVRQKDGGHAACSVGEWWSHFLRYHHPRVSITEDLLPNGLVSPLSADTLHYNAYFEQSNDSKRSETDQATPGTGCESPAKKLLCSTISCCIYMMILHSNQQQ